MKYNNPHLEHFGEEDTLRELINQYLVEVSEEPHPINLVDRFVDTNTVLGMCYENDKYIWLNSRQTQEEMDVSITHEFLHAYVCENGLESIVSHEDIEIEANNIAVNNPSVPQYLITYYHEVW